jgi:hypothetical protein
VIYSYPWTSGVRIRSTRPIVKSLLETRNDPTLDDLITDLTRPETQNDPTLDDSIIDPTRPDMAQNSKRPDTR